MERILYFDCFAGISGDMSLGAFIDLGLDSDAVINEIKKLDIKGYDIEIKKINRFSIAGTDVKVKIKEQKHEHNHDQEQGHDPEHKQELEHDHRDRNLAEIIHIIQNSEISQKSKFLAIRIFTEIAQAEAKVHGKSIDQVHFHEVGAIDSIVDIVGVAICIDMLKVNRIYCSPVHEGKGFIHCRHGRLPIPVPAVIQMLEGSGISIITEDIEAELVTPTGFGILKTLSLRCGKMPDMMVEGVGYGFGKTETGRLNALRVILGISLDSYNKSDSESRSISEASNYNDTITLLETNIDDSTGEILGYTMDRLLEAGALDVYYTPIFMKKNRPSYMLSVMCKKHDTERISNIVLKETSTIGIRVNDIQRITLERSIRTLNTEFGEVRVKSVVVGGLERIQPEYEDCVKLAREHNLSLNEVYEIVKRS